LAAAFFDQIRFIRSAARNCVNFREDFPHGRARLDIAKTRFGSRSIGAFWRRIPLSICVAKGTSTGGIESERAALGGHRSDWLRGGSPEAHDDECPESYSSAVWPW